MKRYFLYFVVQNMLVNVIAFVPQILIGNRFHGSVMAILVSVPIGMLLIYVFLKSLACFPESGLPEILCSMIPKWAAAIVILFLAVQWFLAGAVNLLVIVDLSIRYISPETPFYLGIFMFLAVCGMASQYSSQKIVYLLEVILILYVPLILIILAQLFINRTYNWDAVLAVAGTAFHPPSWKELSAGTYVFSGYANLVILNRIFQKPVSANWVWLLGSLGFTILIISFTIPIAFQGADGVGDFVYPWITTADSLRFELGFVERVLYIFLLLYAGISTTSIILHWHIASEFIKDALPERLFQIKFRKGLPWAILGLFSIVTVILSRFYNESEILGLGISWLKFRFASEILLVGFMLFAAMRRRRA